MKYTKCWAEDAVNLYFTTESREKEKEVFLKTHIPIDKIKVAFSKDLPGDQNFITEGQLKELVTHSVPQDRNRIFLIVGETGCGKSELCQWLDYNIDDPVHIPIHISRADTKIEDIAKRLRQHLPDGDREEYAESELINQRSTYLAEYIIIHLKLQLDEDRSIKSPSDRQILEKLFNDYELKRRLSIDIDDYKKRISTQNKERGLHILSKNSFNFFPIVSELRDRDGAYLFVNKVITRTLKERLKVTDLGKKLQQISEHYLSVDKRPVLLLEDLTSFTFLAEDLMDYLFDLSKGHFDVVIGWTTGFESGNAEHIFKAPDTMTYMKERLKARFLLSDPSEKSAFFLKDSYKNLAQIYLEAIKCGKCPMCQDGENKFYPFNSECLDRIYQNLQEEGNPKRTPRIFLEFILKRVLNSNDSPWKTLSLASAHLKGPPSLIGQTYKDFSEFVELLKWYGKQKDKDVQIDSKILESFDIISPIPANEEGMIIVPMSQMGISVMKSNIPFKEKEKKTTEEDISDFQNWINRGGGKFLTRESLRKGVAQQVRLFGDPCILKNPHSTFSGNASLFYQRGDTLPIVIEDSGDDLVDFDYKLFVKQTTDPEILEQLYHVGKGGSVQEDNLVSIIEWAKEKSIEYNNKLMTKLGNELGLHVRDLALFAKFLLANLAEDCDKPEIGKMKGNLTIGSIPRFSDDYLNLRAKSLVQRHEEIQNLFSNFFWLTKSFLDYQSFEKTLSHVDLEQTLNRVSKINYQNIRESFKWGNQKGSSPFRDLVRVIRDYSSEINQYPYMKDFEGKIVVLREIEQLIPKNNSNEDLAKNVNLIKTACSALGIPLEQQWIESFERINKNEYDFSLMQNIINTIIADFSSCENIFRFIQFQGRYERCSATDEWKLLTILIQISEKVKVTSEKRPIPITSTVKPSKKRVRDAYDNLSKLAKNY
ncbi:MAG: hypothetical protein NWF04_01670 [Candidatus Bathyarchaeota archaeon]|nr:hypothetical protein [Candidatus Bathyarchaeota archaeon]